MHSRVRHPEIGLVDRKLVVEQQVKIERTCCHGEQTDASMFGLGGEQSVKEASRIEACLELHHRVEVIGLLADPDGSGPVNAGARDDACFR